MFVDPYLTAGTKWKYDYIVFKKNYELREK